MMLLNRGCLCLCLMSMAACQRTTPAHHTRAADRELLTLRAAVPEVPRLGPLPRIFSSAAGSGAVLQVYLPQPAGLDLLVDTRGCNASELSTLFGVGRIERVDRLSSDDNRALLALDRSDRFRISCPPGKPLFAQRAAEIEGWLVQVPRFADPTHADAGIEDGAVVLQLPQRCVALVEHFRVPEWVRETPDAPAAPALAPDYRLSCGAAPEAQAPSAWQADVVSIGERDTLIELSQGSVTLYVRRVDGASSDADSQAKNNIVLDKLAGLFAISNDRRLTLRGIETPAVALDLCAERCAGFVPSHLYAVDGALRCAGGSQPDDHGDCAGAANSFGLRERIAEDGSVVHDLTRANDPAWRGASFAACAGRGSWATALGLPVAAASAGLIAAAGGNYARPDRAAVVPCIRDTSCHIAVGEGDDISQPALLDAVADRCYPRDAGTLAEPCPQGTVVSLQLAATAKAGGSLNLSRDSLPKCVSTVRLIGAAGGTTISAATHLSGARPSRNETPALSVRGSLTVESVGITWAAVPTPVRSAGPATQDSVFSTPNRVAIEASDGATVLLRNSRVGVDSPDSGAAPGRFYAAIRARHARVWVWHSQLQAFTTAIDATASQVVVLGDPLGERARLSVLTGAWTADDLVDLSGARIGTPVTNFAALRVSDRDSQTFLGSASISGLVGILYQASGSGVADLQALDTEIAWDPECSGRALSLQTRALDIAGSGELQFKNVHVKSVGSLVHCASAASLLFDPHSTFETIAKPFEAGRCKVTKAFDYEATACSR